MLREILNEMMEKEEKDPNKILKISRELDLLIVEYYKEVDDTNERV